MKIEDVVVGERYWIEMSSSLWLCECLGVGEGVVAVRKINNGFCTTFNPSDVICKQVKRNVQPRWWEFWKRKPAAVSEVRKESPIGEIEDVRHVSIPVGKEIETIDILELRMLQKAVLDGCQLQTGRERRLLDACISYVCVNAKPK